jgi:cystathionine beta-lyase
MRDETKIVVAGRDPEKQHGVVNPPVYHASTVIHPTLDALDAAQAARARDEQVTVYGRSGTPTSFAFENAVAQLEGGFKTFAVPSGLAAVTVAMLSSLKSGDHVLMVDTVYGPTRKLCDGFLQKMGIETTYYVPEIGADIAGLMRPNTKVVYVEAPGSLTFEMQDIPAIAAVAKARGATVIMDNTWASPLYFKPFEKGVDISVQAATKYIVGHSDAMLGAVTATKDAWTRVRDTGRELGYAVGPDDLYLGQRGFRTLAVRLAQHWKTGVELATWLKARPEVIRVMHPALPDDPGHAIWKRDFLGASGLFAIEIEPTPRPALAAMMDHLEYFGMGYSWGGYESLMIWAHPDHFRTARPWDPNRTVLRIHAGLENIEDLKADLVAGFERRAAVLKGHKAAAAE